MAVMNRPAQNYEISIYRAYPLIFWVLLITVNICGSIAAVIRLHSGKRKAVYPGIVVLILGNILLLSLPLFRGYPVYGTGDILSHIGGMRIIVGQSSLPESNFYPLLHIFYSELSLLTRIPPGRIAIFGSIIFYISYVLSILLVARRLVGKRGAVVVVLFSLPFMHTFHHVSNQPAFIAFFLFPFLLYTLLRRQARLFIIFYLAIAFTHPLSAIFSTIFISIIIVFYRFFPGENHRPRIDRESLSMVNLSAFSALILYAWYFSYEAIQRRFVSLIMSWRVSGDSSTGNGGAQAGQSEGLFSNAISIITSKITQADFTVIQLVDVIISRVGQMLIYYSMFGVALCWLLYRIGLKRDRPVRTIPVFTTLAVTTGVIGVVLLVFPWPIGGVTRNLKWTTLFIAIALPFILLHRFEEGGVETRRMVTGIVLFCVLSGVVIGAFNVHPSPNIYKSNPQVTETQIDGSGWYLDHRSDNQVAIHSHAPLGRLMHYHSDLIYYQNRRSQIPPHFGYTDDAENLSTVSDRPVTLHTIPLDRQFPQMFPPNVRENMAQYTDEDFARLRTDSRVNKVYTNDGYNVWFIP